MGMPATGLEDEVAKKFRRVSRAFAVCNTWRRDLHVRLYFDFMFFFKFTFRVAPSSPVDVRLADVLRSGFACTVNRVLRWPMMPGILVKLEERQCY